MYCVWSIVFKEVWIIVSFSPLHRSLDAIYSKSPPLLNHGFVCLLNDNRRASFQAAVFFCNIIAKLQTQTRLPSWSSSRVFSCHSYVLIERDWQRRLKVWRFWIGTGISRDFLLFHRGRNWSIFYETAYFCIYLQLETLVLLNFGINSAVSSIMMY